MKPKKKKRPGARRSRTPKPAYREGERVWILRHPDAEAKVKELEVQRRAETDPAKLEQLAKEIYDVGFAPGHLTVIGILSTDPKVVLHTQTHEPLPGVSTRAGDILYLESPVQQMREIASA